MPGHVAPFVGGDRGLDVGASELGDEHIEHVGHRSFAGGGLNILSIHLGPHAVLVEEVAQSYGVGQVHIDAGGRRSRGGHGGEADILLGYSHFGGEEGVDGVLNHQFGHNLPSLASGGVGVVGPVDLGHARPGDELFRFAGIYEGAGHIDIAVDDVILGILVDAVDPLFREHHGDIGPGYAADVRVVIYGAPHLIFDHI